MSNTDRKYLDDEYKDKWEVPRRQSLTKVRTSVDITGKTYTEKYVVDNNLLDDFVLTRDMVCAILKLSDQVVDTYVMPRLDIAYAEKEIRKKIGRPRIQVVVSKSSLMNFIGYYIDSVEDKQEVYSIAKIDYDEIDATGKTEYSVEEQMLNAITVEVYEYFKNRKYIQQFLSFSTNYLENHIYNDCKTNLSKDKEKAIALVQNTVENMVLSKGLQSYRSISISNEFKHSMQARRYVEDSSHYEVKVKPLEPSSKDKKDVIRFIMEPTVYIDDNGMQQSIDSKAKIDTKKFYVIAVKTKTIEYLNALKTGYPTTTMFLKSVVDNMDAIMTAYKFKIEKTKRAN